MKTNDITKQVMGKIVKFEEKRSKRWYQTYGIFLLFSILTLSFIAYKIVLGYREQDVDFITSWYFEDWEVFTIIWKDALEFIWSLLPLYWVYGAGVVIVIILSSIWITRKKRRIIKKRLQSVEQVKKEGI